MFNNLYWAWDGVLDKAFCEYALQRVDWENAEVAKLGGGAVNEEKRLTEVVWEDIQAPITAVAMNFMRIANERAGWGFDFTYPEEVQMGKYSTGGHYDWHVDAGAPHKESNLQRKLSCSILLNDPTEYEGGKFEIEKIESGLPNSQGSVIVFPSIIRHRVTPVTSGTRYSAVCWAVGAPFK